MPALGLELLFVIHMLVPDEVREPDLPALGLERYRYERYIACTLTVREPDLPVMGLEQKMLAVDDKGPGGLFIVREPDLPVMGLELRQNNNSLVHDQASESLTCPLWDWNS